MHKVFGVQVHCVCGMHWYSSPSGLSSDMIWNEKNWSHGFQVERGFGLGLVFRHSVFLGCLYLVFLPIWFVLRHGLKQYILCSAFMFWGWPCWPAVLAIWPFL